MKKFWLQRLRVRSLREWRARTFILIAVACAAAYPSVATQSKSVPLQQELRVIEGAKLIHTEHKNSGVTFFVNANGVNQHWFVPSHAFNIDVGIHSYIKSVSNQGPTARIGVYEKDGRNEVWQAEILGREVYSYQRATEVFDLKTQLWWQARVVSFFLAALALLSIFRVEPQ